MSDDSFAHGLIGVTLDGRYRLDAILGEGGMGSVFRATQLAMDRKVAVKLLKPHLTTDRVALERFSREAHSTLKVDSPHAVKVLDFGITPAGHYYMVLEYLDGRTVQRELEIDGLFTPARVAHIARQALDALAAAHSRGLVHRDVKPENLLLMRAGADGDYTKVLDFGVAKLMQGAAGEPAALSLTGDGMVFGTPEFMSPEQACGQPLDGRSDLYSLAATMFVMLTGARLFEASSAIAWLTHHVCTPAPRLAAVRPELAVYPELDELLQGCLAKQRELRPSSADELARRLADLVPALAQPGGTAAARTPTRPTTRPSSFVHVLRDAVARDVTLPIAAAGAAAATLPAPPAAAPAAPPAQQPRTQDPPRRRGSARRWLGGLALACLVGTGAGVALDRRASRSASRMTSITASATASTTTTAVAPPATTAVAPSAAPSPQVPAISPTPVASPASAPRPRAPGPLQPAARLPSTEHRTEAEAEEHLRNAEDALRRNNQLRQLAEADLALRADTRSVRARYLLGDALIKSGDLDRGCKYLAAISRIAEARDRARAAGCASD